MSGAERVGNGGPSSQKDDGWFWPYRPADSRVDFIDAKSGLQKRADSLEAQVAKLTKLVEELQKRGQDKEVDLFARTGLSLEEDSRNTAGRFSYPSPDDD